MPRAHEPERTCVGCRGRDRKHVLLRLVVGQDGAVAIDPSGRGSGRGAYVHRAQACVDAALARGALVRALRTEAATDAAARLRREFEGALRT